MPNVSPLRFTTTLHMRCDEQFLTDLDDLRAKERPILSRADYLRKLVAEAKGALLQARDAPSGALGVPEPNKKRTTRKKS